MELLGSQQLQVRGLTQGRLVGPGRALGGSGRGYILGKANEILVIGVDIGELDVNQQHDLNSNKESQKEKNQASLSATRDGTSCFIVQNPPSVFQTQHGG